MVFNTCVSTVHVSVTVLTWLSGIMCFIVIVMEVNRKNIRQYPGNLPLIFTVVALCFNMSLGVGPTVRFKQVTEFPTSPTWRSICIAQSAVYQFCGVSTLYWYATLAHVMHSIIVNHTRVHDLRENCGRWYFWGIVIPAFSTVIPWSFGVYEPRTGQIECWIDDPWWQFFCLYLWVFLGALYGADRSYRIVRVLRRTAYKTGLGGMHGNRGRTVLHTLKEHLLRQVCFVLLYVIFACINLLYFAWSSLVDRGNDDGGAAVQLEEMRMKYTTQVLAYVLDRIEVLAVDEGIGREFMEVITEESHVLFSVGGGGGRNTGRQESGEPWGEGGREGGVESGTTGTEYDSEGLRDSDLGMDFEMPTDEDLDERLRRAKERFEEIVEVEKREEGVGLEAMV
ncbi:hypothetical protein TrCOL_g13319 [Triparma columacea]|uniref:G-protein coupled receptors family 2 profile 2 domain-containing protein n=1 Tax=Triparma columacea TaxID=722753 RepID=A0A9W7GJA4_9STRA|nr:hypothetical protein TrCOL_g13319 [Triparma columacea]